LSQTGRETLEFYIHDGRRIGVEARLPADWTYNWHHVAGVYDGSALRLYVNGDEVASRLHQGVDAGVGTDSGHAGSSVTNDGRIDGSYFPVNVGRNAETHREQFQGWISNATIDDVRIYDRGLPADELGRPEPAPGALLALAFDEFEEHEPFLAYGSSPFSINGVIFSDRSIQPETWQMKRSHAPVRVEPIDLADGRLRVVNGFGFTDLDELDATWTLRADDREISQGALALALAPRDTTEITIPLAALVPEPGVIYWLTITFAQREPLPGLPAGHEVAFAEYRMPHEAPGVARSPEAMPELAVQETGDEVRISGGDFVYTFSRSAGTLGSMAYRGVELLRTGPVLNVWRAPIQNELSDWGKAEAVEWRQLGLDRLEHAAKSVRVDRRSAAEVVVESRVRSAAPGVPAGFENLFRYRVFGSGDVIVEHAVVPFGYDMPWLPRLGLTLELPEEFGAFSWYGRGPFETYPDRKTGAKTGVYSGTVDEQYVPYVWPQDHGNKTDVRWAALVNDAGIGLAAVAMPEMNVSVTRYTNLDRTVYAYQLQRGEGVTLNLLHRVSGVGDTPVPVRAAYRTHATAYEYAIRLRPFASGETSPLELGREVIHAAPLPPARLGSH
jgi:beta-galactosidase